MAEQHTPTEFSREWFIEQAHRSAENVEQLRKAFPGCFDANGKAIVASAHLPRRSTTQTTGGGKP
ncbi:hypothetical protein [Rhizobacter sp. OV335]|uniref:hypothetical protein n=1 Tax=Rhizobacter sp. OV335 TaxID=1500264 RepID=UPI0009210A80|nr:hypothetical protein [Rhizobacter sp. OV335]SHN40398.1 hypothetical protein SAMN02787076_06238 [Rhizobacter sp. OV335]